MRTLGFPISSGRYIAESIFGLGVGLTYTDSGKAALYGIMGLVGSFVGQVRGMINQAIATVMPFVDVFRDTIGGMVDAFMAGDLGLAATVAMTGVQLAFELGKSLIVGIWLDLKERVIGVWDSIMVGASGAAGFISSLFSSAMNAVFQSSFGSQMLAGWEVFREAAKAALEYVIDFAQDVYDTFMNIARAIRSVVGLVVANAPMIAKAAQQKAREVFVAQAPPAAVTAIDQAMEAGGKAMEATRERQGAARDERQASREEFNTKQDAKIVALQQELAALTEKASQQGQEIEAKRAADRAKSGIPGLDESVPDLNKETTTEKVFGTFSAAAAASLSRGGGVRPEVALIERQIELAKEAKRDAMKQEALLEKIAANTLNATARAG